MNNIKFLIIALLNIGFLGQLIAQDCSPATKDIDLAVNNVRARLQGGGDVWWDGSSGKYVVPKVEAGLDEVSSIYAAAVWIGGYDPGGNLKLAAQRFGRSRGEFDFYPGPLDPETGTTEESVCKNWDNHFVVTGKNIEKHLSNYEKSKESGEPYNPSKIPLDVKGWPAKGNPFFFEIWDFELPNTKQGLGSFYDADGDFLYDPTQGDYPIIEIRGCPEPQYADEMIFWIYNDAGGTHKESGATSAIQMEVQVQAFAYATNDELNDMTFMRYKLINRAIEDIDECYFGYFIDPDLGCHEDDYTGCDTTVNIEIIGGKPTPRTRDLMYVYNEDAVDGSSGCSCAGGAPTYCENVPILGVDYFRGPLKPVDTTGDGEIDTLIELGMSSFIYFNNGISNPNSNTTDPSTAEDYYSYLKGLWKDDTPMTIGGTGYKSGGAPTKYAFPGKPNDDSAWSMCTANLPFDDRRTVQASGPFLLKPGAVNELIVGVPWVPNIDYPCPDISRLLFADDLAQSLFNNCFDITDGPDAPDVDFVELDRTLIGIFSNDENSNNVGEKYSEPDLLAPGGVEDPFYKFQGYKLYQLSGPQVTTGELDNPEKAALIYQCDVVDGVSKIYNWKTINNPGVGTDFVYVPELQVEGEEAGISHTIKITEDRFAVNDRRLVNNKKYYFVSVAYAYNDYDTFDPNTAVGQKNSYLEGRRNIKTYVASPRQIVDRNLGADYGTSPKITRVDGVGAGHLFVDEENVKNAVLIQGSSRLIITKETEDAIMSGKFDGLTSEVTYDEGTGPVEVKVYDPLRVKNGEFVLTFIENNDDDITPDSYWELTSANGDFSVVCDTTIAKLNEQLITEYGFSITVGQTKEPGSGQFKNGNIGGGVITEDAVNAAWFRIMPPNSFGPNSAFLKDDLDGNHSFYEGVMFPFDMCRFRIPVGGAGLITPGWVNSKGAQVKRDLKSLNNIDVVLTSDKKKWSRCVVLESANSAWYGNGPEDLGWTTIGDKENMRLRGSPSVGKDGKPDGTGDGMGWFPGYAIDVETGKRLDIFFGENSCYREENIGEEAGALYNAGTDMIFNPGSELFPQIVPSFSPIVNAYFGGQHMIWVSDVEYDECKFFKEGFADSKSDFKMSKAMNRITWAVMAWSNPDFKLKSVEEGIVPSDLKIVCRVDNPYAKYKAPDGTAVGPNNGLPMYKFKFEDVAPTELSSEEINTALDQINVVPNPYYAYSAYETSQFTNVVKITNLPAKCTVNIFSLDGKFIRQYTRDEVEVEVEGKNRAIPSQQINASVSWDLKNSKGIPVSSGVYLIHIDAGNLGERVIKWFGINRQFDPSGL